tara:strand:- start:270 stop:662 length:393 start_codon:yes stop_codon:yes gene_type:complete
MRISKLIGALGNLKQISEGVRNKIFKKEDVEAVAKLRWQECKICPLLDKVGKTCAVNGTQPCCSDCGCSLSLKLRALSSSCPKGRWSAVMPSNIENMLKQQIVIDEKKEHDEKIKQMSKNLKLRENDSNI